MADYLRTTLDKYGAASHRVVAGAHIVAARGFPIRFESNQTVFGTTIRALNGSREGFSYRQDLGFMTLGQIAHRRGDLRGAAPLSD
jgi:hypothetical protein